MSQPQQPNFLNIQVQGLHLNPSTFGKNAPPGALTVADNVVIDRPSVVATRRGFDNSFSTLTGAGASSLFQYNNTNLLYGTDKELYVDLLADGSFTPYSGTYDVPDPTSAPSRIRAVEANKNFYFITEVGTYRLDHTVGQPRLAGAPPGLSGTGAITGVTGFLPASTNIAYRVVFGYTDYNQQLVLGAPSSRIVVRNTGATSANVTLTFQVPKEIQAAPANFFYQVYRGSASVDLATEPDDEMSLTYEEVFAGGATVVIVDQTPSSLLGAALYTNQGQDGILQANYRPPWATDICLFKQYAFYANTRSLQTAPLTLIVAGALNGTDALIPGDTVTFTESQVGGTSFTLTATAGANNLALGQFTVSNTGNPGYDLQITASNIALVSNGYASNVFLTGYYISSDTDLPGKLSFSRLDLVADAFTITSSRANCWEQALPATSVNDARPNRIYYSKFNQPEAVPLVNYVEVGSANQPINRIIPLRDGVMVLKQDGVFRISNAAPPFNITPIDYNIRILADNTAAELDNSVYFLSDQGVVALSDSDAKIMSFVLDKTIIENTSPELFPNLQEVAWGIAYQSARKYILFMPLLSTDTQSQQQYVYNHLTEVWTRWTLGATCGVVLKSDGKLYLGSKVGTAPGALDSYVYQERKSFTRADYADNQYTATNTTVGSVTTIVINNPLLPPNVALLEGWTVLQAASGASAKIVSSTVGLTQTTLVLDAEQVWAAGALIVYTPVYSTVETIQLDCQDPGMNKQFTEIVYMFTEQGFTTLDARISSNTAGIPVLDILTPTIRGGWGVDPWGTSPWGGSLNGQGKIRRYVPQAIQRAGWLYVNISNAEAFTTFGWSGAQLYYKVTSTRQF